MTWLRNVLIAADQLVNAMLGGHPDETLSARAYRKELTSRRWAVARKVIDALFRPLERDHRKAREAPPFRAGRDRAARAACHVVAFRIISP